MPYISGCSAFLFVPDIVFPTTISEKPTEFITEKTVPFGRRVQVAHYTSPTMVAFRSLDIQNV